MNLSIMKYFSFLLFIFFLCNCCSKWNDSSFNEAKGKVFGSTYYIKYESKKNHQINFDSIFNEINQSVNTYNENSLLSKWNTSSVRVMEVDNHLKKLFIQSQQLHKISDGFFDPTVLPLVNFYGFGSKQESKNPTSNQIDSILRFVGIQKIKLKNNKLIKLHPNIQMDFNSIAPGYTSDLIGQFLESKKITNYLVDIGGEIRVRGTKRQKLWKVGIEDPTQKITQRKAIQRVNLINQSLATSGNYRKVRFNQDGNRISHTVNPKTGKAYVNNLLSVTVITKNAIDADGLATIGMVLGLDKAKEFYTKNQISVFLIYEDNKKLKTQFFGDFKNFMVQNTILLNK